MSINKAKNSMGPAKRWQQLNVAILLLLAAIGYSSQSAAVIVAGSCTLVDMTATDYTIKPFPAQMYNGFVVASRTIYFNYTFRKTDNAPDTLYAGAWYASGELGPDSTIPASDGWGTIPGLGFRMSHSLTSKPVTKTLWSILNSQTVSQAGTMGLVEPYLLEFVVTDANLYKGGSPAAFKSSSISIIFGNVDTWTQQNATQGSTRCVAVTAISPVQLLTVGGTPPPVLPPPTLPTCTLGTNEILVPLDPLDASQLATIGKTASTTGFTIPLGTCGKNAKPYITLTDSANLGNRTSDLTLAPSSTAKGVLIRLSKGDGSALQLGAQNTSVSANNIGQFLVGTSPADNTPMSIKLNAAYVRTAEKIEAGSVKADAIFTVAYP